MSRDHRAIPIHARTADTRLIDDGDECLRCTRPIILTLSGWVHAGSALEQLRDLAGAYGLSVNVKRRA